MKGRIAVLLALLVISVSIIGIADYYRGPVANFNWEVVNNRVFFDARSSYGWGPLEYSWSFGDGTGNVYTSLSRISHFYTYGRQYYVTLTIRDALGKIDSQGYWVSVPNTQIISSTSFNFDLPIPAKMLIGVLFLILGAIYISCP